MEKYLNLFQISIFNFALKEFVEVTQGYPDFKYNLIGVKQ